MKQNEMPDVSGLIANYDNKKDKKYTPFRTNDIEEERSFLIWQSKENFREETLRRQENDWD